MTLRQILRHSTKIAGGLAIITGLFLAGEYANSQRRFKNPINLAASHGLNEGDTLKVKQAGKYTISSSTPTLFPHNFNPQISASIKFDKGKSRITLPAMQYGSYISDKIYGPQPGERYIVRDKPWPTSPDQLILDYEHPKPDERGLANFNFFN